MTIVSVHALDARDLRRLGHNLPAQVRHDQREQREQREAVDRSLALHDEALSEEDAAAIEQATASEWLAA